MSDIINFYIEISDNKKLESNLMIRIGKDFFTLNVNALTNIKKNICDEIVAKQQKLLVLKEGYSTDIKQCVPKAHKKKDNPLKINLKKDEYKNIKSIDVYKTKQENGLNTKDTIYTIEPTNEQNNSSEILYLQANLTTKETKEQEIKWGYYLANRNEDIKKDPKELALSIKKFNILTQNTYNKTISIDLKDIKRLDNQILYIFAYKNTASYETEFGTPCAKIYVSSLPVLNIKMHYLALMYQEKIFKCKLKSSFINYCDEKIENNKKYKLITNTENPRELTFKEINDISINLSITSNQDEKKEKLVLKEENDLLKIENFININNNNNNLIYVNVDKYKITTEMLRKIFNEVEVDNSVGSKYNILKQISAELNRVDDYKFMYEIYKLDTRDRLEHFFAQCVGEVGAGLKNLTENLNYTTEALKQTFSYFKNNPDKANELGRIEQGTGKNKKITQTANQEAIANLGYDDDNRDKNHKLGNTQEGDGYKYRGRGLKQVTGRTNYTEFSKYARDQNWVEEDEYFVKFPDEIATSGKFALLSAMWYWIKNKIYSVADESQKNSDNEDIVEKVTKIVNGETNGLEARKEAYKKIRDDNVFKIFE